MIQQIRKINLLATAAMLITFSISVTLVILNTPRKTCSVKSDKTVTLTVTSQRSSPSTGTERFRFQPDSPIRFADEGISFTRWDLFKVTNCSNRTVRVFVIGHHSKTSPELDDRASIYGIWSSLALEPGKSTTWSPRSRWSELWVDFVEFSDGSTWGPNEMKSQENVDATRAALKEATLRFAEILQKQGPNTLAVSFWKETINPQSQMHDSQWKQDFDSTVRSVRDELERVKYDAFKQFRHRHKRNAVLRDKLSAILSQLAEAANQGSSVPDSSLSK